MTAAGRMEPSRRIARMRLPAVVGCAVTAAIVVLLAAAVLPNDDAKSTPTPPPATELAAISAPPTATVLRRDIKLDLGPIVTAAPTEPPATVEPTVTRTPRASEGSELVVNGDFEVADASWYVEQGAGIATGDAKHGSGYLAVDHANDFADQRVPIQAGRTYRVSLWTRAAVSGGQIGIKYEDDRFNVVADGGFIPIETGDGGWTRVTFLITPPPGAIMASLSIWNPNNAPCSIDNVSVREQLS